MVKEVIAQFLKIWRGIKPIQKVITLTILLVLMSSLGILFLKSSSSSFVPLYPKGHLQSSEVAEIKNYLEHFGIPFKEGKKGLLVQEDVVDRLRGELATWTIPQGKGFELFDTNTWIKGEKELQVLEMRALKGQLEKDLAGFDQIKSASVILDIPPARNFGPTQYNTKASVILTLMPGARLSTSQLRAITFHLAGAVRGLEPNMIAISDTRGKLYKAIDPEGEGDNTEFLLEESVQERIDEFLTKLVGSDRFFSNVQATMDRGSLSLSVSIVIDETVESALYKEEVTRQLETLAKGYGADVNAAIDFIPFEKKSFLHLIEKKESGERIGYLGLWITLLVVFLAILCSIPLFRRTAKLKEKQEPQFQPMTRVDIDKLADSMKEEDPRTIAIMLSYLEPARAEKMIAAFPEDFQDEIFFHLSEMEQDP